MVWRISRGRIQLQGQSACLDELFISETAYLTWLDCLGGQPNPKQRDIDLILDRRHIPKAIQDRDIVLWPRDRQACRARLQAIVDRELPRLKALEETLRVQYEEPAKAEARVMALASVTREEMKLLRAEQIHEQSYQRAATALLKARQQSAAARAAAARERVESKLIARPIGYLTLGVEKPPQRRRASTMGPRSAGITPARTVQDLLNPAVNERQATAFPPRNRRVRPMNDVTSIPPSVSHGVNPGLRRRRHGRHSALSKIGPGLIMRIRRSRADASRLVL